jgi:hypothetical protein
MVSFSPTSEMCLVNKHENKNDLFYSAHELHIMKLRRILDSNNLMENIGRTDFINVSDTSAFLGFENILPRSTYMEVIQRRRASVEAVLCEQHRQLSLKKNDPNTLSKISAAKTAWARDRARTIGLLHSD